MNILQAHKYYWHRDGASNYCLDLSTALEKRGNGVIPFAMKHPKNLSSAYRRFFVSRMELGNPKKIAIEKKMQYAARMIYSLEAKHNMDRLLEHVGQVDVAHIHNIYHHISPSILVALKKKKVPIVMTLHDYKLLSPNYTMFHHGAIHEEDAWGWYGSCAKHKCMKDSRVYSRVVQLEMIWHHKIMRYYERLVDLFIAPSQFMLDMCVKHGWDRERFVHLPNPIDAKRFAESNNDGQSVAYIGRISEEKGLHVLLDAAAMTPEIPYDIVGSGPLEKELKARIRKEHIGNVTMHGFLSGAALLRAYNRARVLVVPSIWYENYPLSVLEAKAKGKMVIGSRIGGIPELLPKQLLVPAGDGALLGSCIRKWYDAPMAKRKTLGKKLRAQVLKVNDVDRHVDDVLGVYERVVSRNM